MSKELVQALLRLKSLHDAWVLVVGDVMLDRHIMGNVERVSPEAPVPVLHMQEEVESLGGAANVANNLAGLGVNTKLVAFVGHDFAANSLRKYLAEKGIGDALIEVSTHPTVTKTRLVANGQQMVRVDNELLQPYGDLEKQKLLHAIACNLENRPSVVILSDYAKGLLSVDVCQFVIKTTKKLGIPVLVDPKGRNYTKYRGATAITPNKSEAAIACGIALDNDDLILQSVIAMRKELDFDSFILTRSEQGVSLIESDSVIHIPAVAKQVFDVSGAGDTVIATMAAGLVANLKVVDALRLANTAAGIVVTKLGAVAISYDDLYHAVRQYEGSFQTSKIYQEPELIDKVLSWKTQKKKVVFTNGCFDLLHAGHVKFLESIKSLGDKLVLAINSDVSVRLLKGDNRPVIPQQDRCRILSALESVDAVIVFDDSNLLRLIEKLRPDVIAKGSNYRLAEVVGVQEIKQWGGQVSLIPICEGYSVADIIERISA